MEATRYVIAREYDEKAQECLDKLGEIMETMERIEEFIYTTEKYVCAGKDSEVTVVSEGHLDFVCNLELQLARIRRLLGFVTSQA